MDESIVWHSGRSLKGNTGLAFPLSSFLLFLIFYYSLVYCGRKDYYFCVLPCTYTKRVPSLD
jgi:hypothetical protein